MSKDTRNIILAFLLSALVLMGWQIAADRYFPAAVAPPAVVADSSAPAAPAATPGVVAAPGGAVPGVGAAAASGDRATILAATPRVTIATPRVSGSINLKGARFDDLVLPPYRLTILKDSPPVRIFSPSGTKDAYFGQFGWVGAGAPPVDALWTADRATLTTAAPVTLRWINPAGAVFEQIIAIDKDFMFTVRQRVTNPGPAPLSLQTWGLVSRLGEGAEQTSFNMHIGPVGVTDGTLRDSEVEYEKLRDDGPKRYTTTGGWLGITEKYWLAAVIPDQKMKVDARFAAAPGDLFQTDFLGPVTVVAPGATQDVTGHFFAGAKEISLLDSYMTRLGIPHFDLAVSWGWFIMLAQPIFHLLEWLFHVTGNFGVAIIGLTLIVRAALFPIANKQYESMAKMRIMGPKMKALQDRYKDDKVKQQQEIMALYKAEKVNPVAGCLPLLIQIPVFYALYKSLMVSIEMRHQPFVLWIKDLSAPDPLTPLNLFGLIPWTPPAMIALGVFPILLGLTMWLQQKLAPPQADPVQRQVFALMPWVLMFVMAPFPAGLQLYWIVNNLVSIGQQWYMLRKYPMPATPAAETVTVAATPAKVTPTKGTPAKPRPARPK
ncbi:membrane protein insertase YidC [Polymorphobacter fuscus]|uniref:Membrane protein insertase YidC n=1 Tax=Sandarakinorhabdus fusca TaxID=1439888 RepID=A0A7C9KHS7_9SPHN|nr:membrane protein insertase YidC [Polymorphobacter fuscus]KAB7647412.1 membrane protein insertase YidC [Polymorphobacter fuscus]MQT16659.1 membrane protein insertase YidC [Polymorphobacter fuscus]NJC09356.1 YidC/Oxa1 family membrane protein insertase [Polymorphobacter fuscus]